MSKHTGWDPGSLKFLAGVQGFNLTFPDAYKDEQALLRLKACFTMMKRLGVSAEQCRAWAGPDLGDGDARGIRNAVKAKYDQAQWLTLAKPLHDAMREKQRAALVSYLIAHSDITQGQTWEDANGLFEHFLIDVETSPSMMTSRIKQAIGSVQLFIQRCLMNLEQQAIPANEAEEWRSQWEWMKNYRVWEANRKVFLYPENWIEPELRDNKTLFFKDLENEMLQNEVTLDTAETAFLHYLEKLDQVARLEIVGMYHQEAEDKDDKDILHVFGRTMGIPHIYYYSQGVQLPNMPNGSDYWTPNYWTPWEKVDVDIEGDHLIPVVWNRRLHLFWPIFTEKAIPPTDDEKKAGSDPRKYLEIQIAWSEYKNKKWSSKRLSSITATLTTRLGGFTEMTSPSGRDPVLETSLYVFKAQIESENLVIRCLHDAKLRLVDVVSTKFQAHTSGGVVIDPPPGGRPKLSSSDNVEHGIVVGVFRFTGCGGAIEGQPFMFESDRLLGPDRSEMNYMTFREDETDGILSLQERKEQYIDTLSKTPGTFEILYPHQDKQFLSQRSFFYQDDTRTFFVTPKDSDPIAIKLKIGAPEYLLPTPLMMFPSVIDAFREYYYPTPIHAPIGPAVNLASGSVGPVGTTPRHMALMSQTVPRPPDIVDHTYRPRKRYRFETFYHPYVCEFIKQLNRYGIEGLFQRSVQNYFHDFFEADYDPHVKPIEVVDPPYPREEVDFKKDDAYALYNWELFFHAPLLIADRLSKNQRFEEAQIWFHRIFDPTDTSSQKPEERYWKVRPFIENMDVKKRIDDLLRLLDPKNTDPQKQDMVNQVKQWRDNPFNPHLIARLRVTAYQKTVVMKYIDNLIAWGDQLFRRDTIESINEATLLYILAAEILGPRPQKLPAQKPEKVWTYNELETVPLDEFSNAMVTIESYLSPSIITTSSSNSSEPTTTFYFCIPRNDKLFGYWDTVADRLFKIRHCMNIEGVVRQLPLFEPPIDPALLVRAVAAGVDISSVLNDINAALEKKDAEQLTLLRSEHEINILKSVKEIKKNQVDEASETLEGLKKYLDVVTARQQYYSSRDFINLFEAGQLALTGLSLQVLASQVGAEVTAGVLHLIPETEIGFPCNGATYGGSNIAGGLQAFGSALGTTASLLNTAGSMSATLGGYQRRKDDWNHQADLATKELEQVKKQILAAEIRVQIAEKELQNHDLQIENAKEVDEFMRGKFTNQELYNWMVTQISGIYFQSYQLTYDVAKRAERCYRFELGFTDSNFIQFGYWDSLKKGLLAGEKLHQDLKRMEMAYLDQNKREYEITKHVSLVLHDPLALIALKETGQCEIFLPEALFDADYPGHYMRRIKSVSLTLPCIVGPYTGINCTLTLLSNKTRIKTTPADPYPENLEEEDKRFVTNFAAMQSIATSHAQNDSGMFELNFRDERYLPFEGAGVISRWRIELPKETNSFDLNTLSDVVLHLKYTAREGGGILKKETKKAVQDTIADEENAPLARLFSLKHEFPSEWHRFLHPKDTEPSQTLKLDLKPERFPFLFRGKTIQLTQVEIFLKFKDEKDPASSDGETYIEEYKGGTPLNVTLTPNTSTDKVTLKSILSFMGGIPHGDVTITNEVPVTIELVASDDDISQIADNLWDTVTEEGKTHNRLNLDAIEDIFIVCHYSVG